MRLLPFSLLFVLLAALPASGQPLPFGASDAPDEFVPGEWWLARTQIGVRGGLALVGPRWHALAGVDLEYARPGFSARVGEAGRLTTDGLREEDGDELYDALRAIRYVRWTPRRGQVAYARVGPLRDVRLGMGHLVDFFATDAAWDARTIGAEASVRLPGLRVDAFSSDVARAPTAGVYVQAQPFMRTGVPYLRQARLGVTYVRDFFPTPEVDAYAVDVSVGLIEGGGFTVEPFASYARFATPLSDAADATDGQSLQVGLRGGSPSVLDLVRIEGHAALLYNGDDFINGFFGPLYPVENTYSAPVDSERFIASDSTVQRVPGVRLGQSTGGSGFETEVRLLFFQRFQLWYRFYSHYGSQPLGHSRLRLYYGVPDGLSVSLRSDRNGLSGFGSLFTSYDDQSTLAIHAEYPFRPGLGVGFDARYTYVRFRDDPGARRFLAQRRFEPYVFYRTRF